MLVTTPGRMFDLRAQGHLLLHRVEWLILDEADQMLDKGSLKILKTLFTIFQNEDKHFFSLPQLTNL